MARYILTLYDESFFASQGAPEGARWIQMNSVRHFDSPVPQVFTAGFVQLPVSGGFLLNAVLVADVDGDNPILYQLNTFNPLDPPIVEAEAQKMNGLVPNDTVGWSADASGQALPTVFSKNQTLRLKTLGGAEGQAYDINDDRQVVGWSENAAGQKRATLWDLSTGGAPQDLGTPRRGRKRRICDKQHRNGRRRLAGALLCPP